MVIVKQLLDFFLPTECLICQDTLHYASEQEICSNCYQKLHWIRPPYCKQCCSPFQHTKLHGESCLECQNNNWHFDRLFACTQYHDVASRLILKLKYKTLGAKYIASSLKRQMLDFLPEIHLITPIPLHNQRLIKRGFNQAELISKQLSKLTNIKHQPNILLRSKNTISQGGLNQQARKQNLKDAFIINPKLNKELFKNTTILLIDDVVTTSATVESAAKTLTASLHCRVFVGAWSKRVLEAHNEYESI